MVVERSDVKTNSGKRPMKFERTDPRHEWLGYIRRRDEAARATKELVIDGKKGKVENVLARDDTEGARGGWRA